MTDKKLTRKELEKKNEELQLRLEEAEETLRAIREGEVDALIVSGSKGEQVFSLSGADAIYRRIVETMKEAAFTVTYDEKILYCNTQFSLLIARAPEQIIGHALEEFVAEDYRKPAAFHVIEARESFKKQRLVFRTAEGRDVPVHVAANLLDETSICVVASDLTELENSTKLIQQLRTQQEKLQVVNEELARAEEELRAQTDELIASQEALQALNAELEKRVAERTSEVVKASQSVQVERRRLNEMLGYMPAYVVLLSPDYHVPFANRFFEERFGKSNGKRCFEYLFGLTEPCVNCETFKVLKTNAPHRWEWLGPDGRNYDIHDFPFIDADGSRLIMEVGLDITERKKAAAEVLAERQRLFDVLETVPAMVCLLTPDYHVAFTNRGFREKFGESHGRRCYEQCFGKTAPCEFCESYRVLETGQPHHWEVEGPDGSVIDAHDFPFTDVDGSPLILEMDIDITEHRRAEAALREASAYNRTLIEVSPDPLVTIGPDGRITDVNAATQHATGRTRQELVGTDFSEYFTEPNKARAGIQQVLHEDNVRDYPLEICHRDGHTTPVLYNAAVYRNAGGEVVGVFAAARDITERKQAERELRRAHEELEAQASQLRALTGELTLAEQRERSRLANLLHDHLQQILVAAKFRLTILGRGGDDVVKQATKEVEDLIDESITASRSLTAELSPPILQEAGLSEGLQWLARRMANTQGLFVNLELNDSGPLPEDLKVMLFQSVRELLFKVVKHANTRSAAVNLRRLDDSLQVTVSDEGIGFDPASMPPAGEGGRGFGLLSLQERLKYMGGTLEIESNPGYGSRFVPSVPVIAIKEPMAQETPISPKSHLRTDAKYPDPGRKIRIVLADDHAIVRQGMATLLSEEPDIEVVGEAADGQEAIELARRLLPDVILMDVSMPKLNGVEATRAIRIGFPEIRVIGLSMFEDIERAQAMRDAGAVDYLTKSGEANVLINAIRKSVQAPKKALSVQCAN